MLEATVNQVLWYQTRIEQHESYVYVFSGFFFSIDFYLRDAVKKLRADVFQAVKKVKEQQSVFNSL